MNISSVSTTSAVTPWNMVSSAYSAALHRDKALDRVALLSALILGCTFAFKEMWLQGLSPAQQATLEHHALRLLIEVLSGLVLLLSLRLMLVRRYSPETSTAQPFMPLVVAWLAMEAYFLPAALADYLFYSQFTAYYALLLSLPLAALALRYYYYAMAKALNLDWPNGALGPLSLTRGFSKRLLLLQFLFFLFLIALGVLGLLIVMVSRGLLVWTGALDAEASLQSATGLPIANGLFFTAVFFVLLKAETYVTHHVLSNLMAHHRGEGVI